MGESLKDNPRLVPLVRCEASLVLDVDMITRDQVRELLAAPGQVLGLPVVSDEEALLPLLGHVLPLLPGGEVPDRCGDVVTQVPPKHNLRWRQVGEGIRSVAVNKQCSSKPIRAQITIWAEVVLNQPFSPLYTDLRMFV
jgi:hypothetical protein